MRIRESLLFALFFSLLSLAPGTVFGQSPAVYFADNFENGLENWLVSNSDWAITQTTSRSGSFSVTDSPSGNFLPNADAVILLKNSIDLSNSVAPVLTYWYKIDVPDYYDHAYVEVSKDGGTSWSILDDDYQTTVSTWRFVQFNLSSYKSSSVKVRFRLRADGNTTVGDGWYIDDVEITEKAAAILPPFSDNFENGLGNWIVSGYDWALTQSTSRSSVSSVTDSPSGNFLPNADAVMVLKNPIDLSNTMAPGLTYWHKIDVPDYYDHGYVEVSKDGGSSWTTVKDYYQTTISTWSFVQLDLSSYKSSSVNVRFRLRANGNATAGGGWFIDDVEIRDYPTAPSPPAGVSVTWGNRKTTITWNNPNYATSYNLYWSTTSGVTKSTGTKIANVTSPFVHEGLTNGTIYYYVVTASNSYGESGISQQVSAKPDTSYITFAVTTNNYADSDNINQACKDENGGRAADWNDIVAYHDSGQSMDEFFSTVGMRPANTGQSKTLRVTSNGASHYNSQRLYFIERHDGNVPGGWSVHATIDNNLIDLGSWYGFTIPALCYTGTCINAPSGPTGVTPSPQAGKAVISWGNVYNATSYNIYWSTTSGVTKTTGIKIGNVTTPYTHTELTNGMTYYYVVTAINDCGESGISSQVSAKPDATYIPPPPPTMITPTSGDKQVVINWTAVTGATSYNLYWSTTPGVTKATGTKISNVTSPYTHTGLTNFTTYYYILVSVNAYGEGNGSSVFSATPKGPPSVPANIKVTEGDGKATITWDNVNGATAYNIYWSTTSGVTKTNGQQILNVTNPFVPENLTNLTTYYYIVTSVNRNYGEGEPTAQFTAMPKGPPYAPKFIRATDADNGQVTITWEMVGNAASYNIYWSTTPGVTTATGTKIANVTSPYTHTGLTNLTTYYYIVTAVNEFGEGPAFLEASETPTSSATTIKFGQVVLGTISAKGQMNQYKFYASANDKLVVSMSTDGNGFASHEPDPYVRLFGTDGTQLCEAYLEDSDTYGVGHIETICSLPTSGVYTILAGDWGGNSTGTYSLYTQRLNKPGNAMTLGFGLTLTGATIAKASFDTYTFSASADDKVLMSMSTDGNGFASHEPDPYVRLFGTDGTQLCEAHLVDSDTYGVGHIETICSLPTSGVYTILAGDWGGNSTGTYSLYAQRLNKPGNAMILGFGQTLTGATTTKAAFDTYTFSSSADDKVSISMSTNGNGFASHEPDPYVRLFGTDGTQLCEAYLVDSDTYGVGHTEATCSLATSGAYTILAGDWGGNSNGSYGLSLSCLFGICDASKTFDIVATAGANGTIIPSGMVTLSEGANQTFTIKPNLNSHIEDVQVDGVSVGAVESYAFTNLKANHTISATFAGTRQLAEIKVTGPQATMTAGTQQTLTATARYSDATTETLTSPSWQSLNTSVATVDTAGKVTAVAAGSTSITASFSGIAGKMDIKVGDALSRQHYGNLILVAGGGIKATNTLKESTQYLADLVYSRFKNRLFTDDDIYYFNPKSWHDLDGDGQPDNIVDDAIPTVAKLGDSIIRWAKDQNSDGPLYIYLIDHGGTDQFLIFPDNEILTADQLKGYLDAFQTATGRKAVVVIEACKSGSFTDNIIIQGDVNDRIIITSTGTGDGFIGLQGRISFTQLFTDYILTGDSLYHAYLKAKSTLMRIGSFFARAEPKLAETKLGSAAGACVGGCFLMAPLIPAFVEQSPNGTINATGTPQTLYAKLASPEGIESVWAVVTPPDFTPPPPSADFETPVINLPVFSLSGPNGEGRFTGTYGPFNKNGDYQVVFYARNNKGIVGSSLQPTIITVTDAPVPGDVNGDGIINLADAILTLRFLASMDIAGQTLKIMADVNGDGKIGFAEALFILQMAAGMR